MTHKQPLDYQALSRALDEVLAKLQEPDVQVDEAIKLYEQGLALITKLEAYVAQAENTITQLKVAASEAP